MLCGKLNLFSFPFNQNSCWNDEIISNRDRELCSRWFICWDDIKLKGIECLGRCVRWKTFGEKRPPLGMRNVCAVRCVTYRGQQSRCVCDYPPYTHIYKWRFNPMRSPLYFSKIEHSFSSFKMMMITQRRNEERLTVVERQLPWRFRRRDFFFAGHQISKYKIANGNLFLKIISFFFSIWMALVAFLLKLPRQSFFVHENTRNAFSLFGRSLHEIPSKVSRRTPAENDCLHPPHTHRGITPQSIS